MSATVVKLPRWGGWAYKDLEGRVTVEPYPEGADYTGVTPYLVRLDGEKVATVVRSTRSWDRKPKGLRYVTARGDTPCWRVLDIWVGPGPLRGPYDTRAEAAFAAAGQAGA